MVFVDNGAVVKLDALIDDDDTVVGSLADGQVPSIDAGMKLVLLVEPFIEEEVRVFRLFLGRVHHFTTALANIGCFLGARDNRVAGQGLGLDVFHLNVVHLYIFLLYLPHQLFLLLFQLYYNVL